MFLSIWSAMNDAAEEFKQWIFDHYNNPLLWVGLIVIGLAVFTMTYNTLNRD